MQTQPLSIRTPPPPRPPGRNASAFDEPLQPRRPSTWWHDVAREVRQVRWPGAREVAARTVVAIGALAFFTLFAAACSALVRAVLGA